MSKLHFFRHAQASYGAANYDKLSPKGEQQASELGKYLVQNNILFDKIFLGPLRRQQHTFELVKEQYDKFNKSMPTPVTLVELREHEATEGAKEATPMLIETVPQVKKWCEDIATNPKLMRRNTLLVFQYFMDHWTTGEIEIKGIQPWAVFRKEVKKGLDNILENTGRGERVGVFTSGGTISAITAESLNLQDEKRVAAMNFSVRNTSFSNFLYANGQFNLLSFNELPHLTAEMVTFV